MLRLSDALDVNTSGKSNTVPTILQYDDTTKSFKLTSVPIQEEFLKRSVEDNNLRDDFVEQVENQIVVPTLSYKEVDAGTF